MNHIHKKTVPTNLWIFLKKIPLWFSFLLFWGKKKVYHIVVQILSMSISIQPIIYCSIWGDVSVHFPIPSVKTGYCNNGISMARRYWKIPSESWEVEAILPTSGGEADGGGGIASTSKDEEGIFQYLRAMLMPLTL